MKAGVMTAEQKRAELKRKGVAIRVYAASCGLNTEKEQSIAYRLLSGYLKGNIGEAHRVAVSLGLKEAA